MTERDRILEARCRRLDETFDRQTVRNLRDHLRIQHRRVLPVDASGDDLRRAWLAFHPRDWLSFPEPGAGA